MNKLLSAGFIRLKKSKIFWILMIFMFTLGLYIPIGQYFDAKKYGYTMILDDCLFTHIMFISVILAVFCSLFVGTEYSDGTIRNKLMIGHSRVSIYISNLIICITAGILFSLSFIIPCTAIGIPLIGFFQMGIKAIAIKLLSAVIIGIAFTAIFTFAAMLIHNKAVLSVVTVITAFLMLFVSTYLYSALSQPEMRSDYIISESGEVKQGDLVPNEFYVTGTKRKVYEFLMEFLPSGQDVLLLNGELPLPQIFLYDTLILAVTTGAGAFIFSKKDIK